MEKEQKPRKSLWILHYAYENRPEMKLQPFYAVDEADVQKQVKQFLSEEGITVTEHYLQPALEGFNIHNTSLPGIIPEQDCMGPRKRR